MSSKSGFEPSTVEDERIMGVLTAGFDTFKPGEFHAVIESVRVSLGHGEENE